MYRRPAMIRPAAILKRPVGRPVGMPVRGYYCNVSIPVSLSYYLHLCRLISTIWSHLEMCCVPRLRYYLRSALSLVWARDALVQGTDVFGMALGWARKAFIAEPGPHRMALGRSSSANSGDHSLRKSFGSGPSSANSRDQSLNIGLGLGPSSANSEHRGLTMWPREA